MFVGREKELDKLNSLLCRDIASLVVIKGRRRIGKSRLIKEFAKPFKTYNFMGLAPEPDTTAQMQRDEFARYLRQHCLVPSAVTKDWGDLFTMLAQQTVQGRVIIVFDEISWMAHKDITFLGKLKSIWDLYFSQNSELILILCGSVSSWIEKNILRNTGYLGRPTLQMTINELALNYCNMFWKNNTNISNFEKLKILSITGGVPRYLELIDPQLSAEDNIKKLCFDPDSPLFEEFKYIFSDIYGKRSATYQAIVSTLCEGKATRDQIIIRVGFVSGGDVSDYLEELEIGGFIARDYTWSVQTKKESSLSYYRLSDNYTRFYLKYIFTNKNKIKSGQFEEVSINNLPGWNSILGLQFENLVVNNQNKLIQLLKIRPEDIIVANPFFQRSTKKQPGCQVDYMIQTKHDVLYICEIKFSIKPLSIDIIAEVQTKINNMQVPKHISRRTVLVHVNGVSDEVIDADYFCAIVDFGKFLD